MRDGGRSKGLTRLKRLKIVIARMKMLAAHTPVWSKKHENYAQREQVEGVMERYISAAKKRWPFMII